MKVLILGCGGSGGVPTVGGKDGAGYWGACDPLERKNQRTRSSIIIETLHNKKIMIDTGPDIRTQLLREKISTLDAVVYTHAHADHIAGLDELRSINRCIHKALPIFATKETLTELKSRFTYAFKPWTTAPHFFRPVLEVNLIAYGEPITIGPDCLQTFEQKHGASKTLGVRYKSIAYSTDVTHISENGFKILSGVETWIIGCFQRNTHPAHAALNNVIEWQKIVKPKRIILTHMGPDMDWKWLKLNLPQSIEVAYDGLTL
ncbi:Coenzyme PQQ synthesis protein B [Commensalibacter sp. Nvir]|uniref:MBL fold metallo-hydrolase n=1 Tax=Commensalibacter sp. Nvir TaxID=3069817 RepID=UPI002D2913E4|nr:Coenzyme PQQ synthesis protein B [Commensalibacter sp. Nvir]